MQFDSDPHGPLYIYNGPADLQRLEHVNLTGARIIFNGSYALGDLRNVNLRGATVFLNGQQASLPQGARSRSPARHTFSERRHSDYYRPHDDLYRPRGDARQLRLGGPQEEGGRKRRRVEDASEDDPHGDVRKLSSRTVVRTANTRTSSEDVKHEPGRLSPYEDEFMEESGKSTTLSAAGGTPMFGELVVRRERHQPQLATENKYRQELEGHAINTRNDGAQETDYQLEGGFVTRSTALTRQSPKRVKMDHTSDVALSEKAKNLANEEISLRLKKRVLANLGRSSGNENAKIEQLSVERQQIESQLLQHSDRQDGRSSNLPRLRQAPQGLPLLLEEPALESITTFANIEEGIIQIKNEYAQAERQLRGERQTVGRASDSTIQRVKAILKNLVELYERREAMHADRSKIDAFRKSVVKEESSLPSAGPVSGTKLHLVSSKPIPGSEGCETKDKCAADQHDSTTTDPADYGSIPHPVSCNVRSAGAGNEAFNEAFKEP